jgi:hypothetical protein
LDYITCTQLGDDVLRQSSRTFVKGVTKIHAGKIDDGPMIYYNHPSFYCDMSGDKEAFLKNSGIIPSASTQVLGVFMAEARPEKEDQEHISARGENIFNHPVDDSSLPSLDVAPLSEIVDYGRNSVELSASGIGGVLPDDHFILHVQRKLQQSLREEARVAVHAQNSRSKHSIEEKIMSTTHFDLPPSKLPPPSYVFLSLSSESSTGLEDDDECLSVEPDESGAETLELGQPAPPAFFARFSPNSPGQRCGFD